jgi:hypothetical protein
VANHPAISDGQREAIAALIERTLTMRDRAVCDALQQELAGTQKNLAVLRKAIEDVLHPKD